MSFKRYIREALSRRVPLSKAPSSPPGWGDAPPDYKGPYRPSDMVSPSGMKGLEWKDWVDGIKSYYEEEGFSVDIYTKEHPPEKDFDPEYGESDTKAFSEFVIELTKDGWNYSVVGEGEVDWTEDNIRSFVVKVENKTGNKVEGTTERESDNEQTFFKDIENAISYVSKLGMD